MNRKIMQRRYAVRENVTKKGMAAVAHVDPELGPTYFLTARTDDAYYVADILEWMSAIRMGDEGYPLPSDYENSLVDTDGEEWVPSEFTIRHHGIRVYVSTIGDMWHFRVTGTLRCKAYYSKPNFSTALLAAVSAKRWVDKHRRNSLEYEPAEV